MVALLEKTYQQLHLAKSRKEELLKRLVKRVSEELGINISGNSSILGLTPKDKVHELLMKLQPINNGHQLVRIGGQSDGGYLLPNDFHDISVCFSPGSNLLWNFERELAESYGIRSYICDSEDQRPPDLSDLQTFSAHWVGPYSDGEKVLSLQDWILNSLTDSTKGDWILQMDIEGAEFLTLLALPNSLLERFRIITIELHFLETIKNRFAFEQIYKPFFEKILSRFDIVHLHPNNCCGLWSYGSIKFPRIVELTLHRKDRRLDLHKKFKSEHELDRPCVQGLQDYDLIYKNTSFNVVEK